MSDSFHVSQFCTLADCNEFQYLLLGDVRDLLEEAPDPSTKKWLLAVLDVLVEMMPHERRLHEIQGGYLSDVLDDFPDWTSQVMELHSQKVKLDYSLRELRNRIRSERSWAAIADQVSSELRDWIIAFRELHRAEASLIVKAMLMDIGVRV